MPNINQVRRTLLKPAPVAVSANWWNTAALYDFDFVNQRGRDVAGATNIAVGSFGTYFAYANGAPVYDANGLLFDGATHFYKVAFAGALATLTAGDDVCVLVETTAGQWGSGADRIFATGGAGSGDLSWDSATTINGWNGSVYILTTIGGGAVWATSHIRCMYRQTSAGRKFCANGGTIATDANKAPAGRPWNLAGSGQNSNVPNGSIRRCIVFDPATVSDAQMQSYTTGTTT